MPAKSICVLRSPEEEAVDLWRLLCDEQSARGNSSEMFASGDRCWLLLENLFNLRAEKYKTTPAGTPRALLLWGQQPLTQLSAQVVCRAPQEPDSDPWEVKVATGWLADGCTAGTSPGLWLRVGVRGSTPHGSVC